MRSLSLALVLTLTTACGSITPSSLAEQPPVKALTDSAQDTARIHDFNYLGAAAYSRLRHQDALLILKDGEVVFEEYQNGYGRDIPHRLNSGTKSFNCLIAVAAQQQGLFRLSQPASRIITEWQNSDKEKITIEHLLNYTSGLPTVPFSIEVEDTHGEILTPPLIGRPGEYYTYSRLHSGAFSLLVERITGQDPVEYLKTTVLDPIGVKVAGWDRDTFGKPLMASGAYLTARDWGQVGQFFLQGGVWQGKRILDPLVLRQCHTRGSRAFAGYGLSF
jgi:CubicO group peptidase (beta-lactamase class C family)